MNDLEFFRENIINTFLVSFGVVGQFIELEFNNEKFESIKLYIDCSISCQNEHIEKIVIPFKNLSKDTYEIAYFIAVNLKKVKNCYVGHNSVILVFDNEVSISLDLKESYANIAATFYIKMSDETPKTISINYSNTDFPKNYL